MKLLISQRNALFDILIQADLNPSNLVWEEYETNAFTVIGTVARLKHIEYDFYFKIYETASTPTNGFTIKFSPDRIQYESSALGVNDWETLKKYFAQWASFLKREVREGDKWMELQRQLNSGASFKSEDGDKFKFSVAEYEDLTKRMKMLKAGVRKMALPPEHLKLIEAKLDHLTEVAKDMNKFDWKGLFIGSIAGIIIQLAMPTAASGALWDLVRQAFSNMLTP